MDIILPGDLLRHALHGLEQFVMAAIDENMLLLHARSEGVQGIQVGDGGLALQGSTLFMSACVGGQLGLATALANRGSDVHAGDNNNMNALMHACLLGHRAVAAMLLDR